MRCPYCGNPDTRVIDSRPAEDKSSIRRRRSCDECGITGCVLILNEQQRGGQGHRQSSEDGEQCFENLHRFKPPW